MPIQRSTDADRNGKKRGARVPDASPPAENHTEPEIVGSIAPLPTAMIETKPGDLQLIERHAPAIEAILLSADRPIGPARLAEALGLLTEDEADVAASRESAGEDSTEAIPAKGRKREIAVSISPVAIVNRAVDRLNDEYQRTSRAFRIERLAGGYRIMTLPRYAPVLEQYHGRRERQSLSRAAVETLAIVAYKQPLTRAGLEAIRGVACGEVLRSLIDRRLVTITGRAEEVGRPILYGTTKQFLEVFGLANLKDLPSVEEFKLRGSVGGAAPEDDA